MHEERAAARFEARLAAWRQRFLSAGAARAYPYAWRLPELARPLGGASTARAQLALAQTLYCLGHFAEAQAALSRITALAATERVAALGLRGRCALILGEISAPPSLIGDDPEINTESAYLAFLADQPGSALSQRRPAHHDPSAPWCTLLALWHVARLGQGLAAAPAHAVLARWRADSPASAAHAEAVLAEAAFHVDPAWSLVWLDAALAQCARYAQHHIEARLLHLKAHALEASGQLHEAARFQDLANRLAQRQGALRYLSP